MGDDKKRRIRTWERIKRSSREMILPDYYKLYSRYDVDFAAADIGSVYLPSEASEASSLTSHYLLGFSDLRGASSDYLQKDVLPLGTRAYGLDDLKGAGGRHEVAPGGLLAGANIPGYLSPLQDPKLLSQKDAAFGINSGILDIINECFVC